MTRHARLSPSKADLWVTCPGGIPFIEANSDRIEPLGTPGVAAAQGTLAHSYAECLIHANIHPDENARDKYRSDAEAIKTQLEDAMIDNAQRYAAWASRFVQLRPGLPWGLELSAPLWYEPDSKGTADFWAVDGDTLVIVDYKSGRIKVDSEQCLQILIYAIAVYDMIAAFNPQIRNFRVGIFQPFHLHPGNNRPDWWELTLEELERWRRFISSAAYEVDNPVNGNRRLVTSEKGCRWCPAKAICPAQEAKRADFAGYVEEDPEGLDGPTLYNIYSKLKEYRTFLDAVEDYVQGQSEDVLERNGYIKKPGRRVRKWRNEEAMRNVCDVLGLTPTEERVRSVKSIEDEIGEEKLRQMFDGVMNEDHGKARVVAKEAKAPSNFKVQRNDNAS